ncbi:MAG: restriction endonuclease subunit S [Hydrogenophaga sp.]|uniref:restriction endonuclease subunit S n=1 Tax=Hydrogenophaga sp. TaxID=1904254 RepID=UPI00275393AF|nr:restriction endonuclease subunit S [Hydrogenophaga sp.]MDP2419219.1 restriction endonuclease subunit S [Hydrogenophaga sp.]MDZ4189753.1 restriction endonuclease subunit S [Hydrogenophaga sp.]
MSEVAEAVAVKHVPLSEAAEINPKVDRTLLEDDTLVSFVPMAAVGAADGRIDVSTTRPYAEVKKGYTAFRNGDVLFAKVTPCMENGKMAVARNLSNGQGFGSTEFHVLRPREGVDSSYLYHFVSSASFRNEAARHMTGAVGLRRVPSAFLQDELIPLPELDEQRRIVAEIDKQFSRLDEAVANLQGVKANLKRYKASVLKAAVEGRLVETEATLARREGRSYETGVQLLQRIAECRRQQWVGRGKYKEAQSNWTGSRKDVPDGWCWTTVNDLAVKIVDGTHHTPTYVDEGIPFISVKDIRESRISFEATRLISAAEHDELSKRCNPEFGDVLITKSGTIGRTAIVATTTPFSLFVSVALIKPVKGIVDPKYLMLTLDAYIQSIDISQDVKGGLLKNLHLEDLRLISVQLPPAAEQVRIVAEVDRHLSVLRGVEAEVDANLLRAQVLRQSVLTSFLGGNNGQANSFLSG